VAACLALACAEAARAAAPAAVEIVKPKSATVWVGERVPFSVDLLARGVVAGAPHFDLPEIEGAVLVKIAERPTLLTRTLGGEPYTVQRHDFALFIVRPGPREVPGIGVRFAARASPTAPAVEYERKTPPFSVTARVPEGAPPGALIVAATNLEVSERWEPPPADAKVGDALTRTVTVVAEGVPGILLPPLPSEDVRGLAVYPGEPEIRDQMARGEFKGMRVDRLTYVCTKPGPVTIPETVIRWWDVRKSVWKEHRLAGVTLRVAENPAFAEGRSAAGPPAPREWRAWSAGAAVILVAAAAAALGWFALAAGFRKRSASPAGREARAFRQVVRACRERDATTEYNAITAWLAVRGSASLVLEAALIEGVGPSDGESELRAELRSLQAALLSGGSGWRGDRLLSLLSAWRRRRGRRERKRQRALPASLNPGNPAAAESGRPQRANAGPAVAG